MKNYNYFKLVLKNLLLMMNGRGYTVSSLQKKMTEEYIQTLYNEPNFELTIKSKLPTRKKTIVKFLVHDKPTPKSLKTSLKDYTVQEYNDTFDHKLVVIFQKPISPNMKKLNKYIQLFCYNDFLVDKASHVLVPKHEMLTAEQGNEIVEQYNLSTKWHIPLLLKTDPMARYYDAQRGDIVKITKKSRTAGIYVSYRIVF
jgi:DNA-directed RNA polymerases I, II, and III subunit RPABC1